MKNHLFCGICFLYMVQPAYSQKENSAADQLKPTGVTLRLNSRLISEMQFSPAIPQFALKSLAQIGALNTDESNPNSLYYKNNLNLYMTGYLHAYLDSFSQAYKVKFRRNEWYAKGYEESEREIKLQHNGALPFFGFVEISGIGSFSDELFRFSEDTTLEMPDCVVYMSKANEVMVEKALTKNPSSKFRIKGYVSTFFDTCTTAFFRGGNVALLYIEKFELVSETNE
jgi:hypothetical protein